MSVKFSTIASGSSGNSTLIATKHTKILIDAGVSGKYITQALNSLHIANDSIDALFITHEHTDHIRGAGILSRKFDIPIYATAGTWKAMEDKIGKISPKNKQFVYVDEKCIINDICVCPFAIPHDAAEPVAYSMETENHKITIATDLGHVTETIKEKLFGSELLLLEANHDEQMLKNGYYPRYLKQRILGENGHISNRVAGNLLCDIMSDKLKYVFLGHLSEENNYPRLAYQTVKGILQKNNIKVGKYLQLNMALQHHSGCIMEL